jgi:hypothetical protein
VPDVGPVFWGREFVVKLSVYPVPSFVAGRNDGECTGAALLPIAPIPSLEAVL